MSTALVLIALVALSVTAAFVFTLRMVIRALEKARDSRAEEISNVLDRAMDMIGKHQVSQLQMDRMEEQQIQALAKPKRLHISEEEEEELWLQDDGPPEVLAENQEIMKDILGAIQA